MPIISGGQPGGVNGLNLLFSSTLGAGASSIDSGAGGFSTSFSILYVFAVARSATSAASDILQVRFNNDSGSTYTIQQILGTNTSATASWGTTTSLQSLVSAATASASTPGYASLVIPAYGATTFDKVGVLNAGTANISSATGVDSRQSVFTWANTAAINRVSIGLSSAANLVAGSALLIYAT